MAKESRKADQRPAKIAYCFDRLWEHKLSQVYHLLVPDKDEINLSDQYFLNQALEDREYENGSHLHQSIFGSTEGK